MGGYGRVRSIILHPLGWLYREAQTTKKQMSRFVLAKDLIMITLAMVCLAGLALEHFGRLSTGQVQWLNSLELGVGLIFLVDFGFEWYFAKNCQRYWHDHWYFLLASVPLSGQLFDIMRGLWLPRILRLFKVFAHLRSESNTWLFEARRP